MRSSPEPEGTAQDLVTGLVAEYVVEKYLVGRLATAEAHPAAVTTAMPATTPVVGDGVRD